MTHTRGTLAIVYIKRGLHVGFFICYYLNMVRIISGKTIMWEEGAAVLVACCFDLLGEPPATLHPVVWYGKLIELLVEDAPQGKLAQLLYGVGMVMGAVPI